MKEVERKRERLSETEKERDKEFENLFIQTV